MKTEMIFEAQTEAVSNSRWQVPAEFASCSFISVLFYFSVCHPALLYSSQAVCFGREVLRDLMSKTD